MPVGTGCGMIWRDMTGRARASGPPRTTHWRGIGCALVVVSMLTGCGQGVPDRRADAEHLTSQLRSMPGVLAATSDVADNVPQGEVHSWLSVEVAEDATADQVAAITSRYLEGLRTVDYSGYQTQLDVQRGANRYSVDSGRRAVTDVDQIVAQARDWVALRREFPSATVELRATITHPPVAAPDLDPGHPLLGTVEFADTAGYPTVSAAMNTFGARYPQLAGGTWTIGAGKTFVTSTGRLPNAQELSVWNTLNGDQTIPHVTVMRVNAPLSPPVWMSDDADSRDPATAVQLADRHLPVVATLPAPVLYTATDQPQAYRDFYGKSTAPVAVTVGGCTTRGYRPVPAEQALIDRYENCRR